MDSDTHSEKRVADNSVENILQQRKDAGVRNIEVYAEQYSHIGYRVTLFFSIFLVAYAYGLDGMLRYTFQSYATSSYAEHSLLSTVNCIKAVVAAAGQFWFARASDIFGRIEILAISVVFYIVGTIIESQAYDVSKFAAGAIFYQLGYTGIVLILEVVASDFSNLNWRLVATFVPALPFIINTWISGNILEDLDDGLRWSWGIGMWAFILPLTAIPLFCCLFHMRYLAKKNAPEKLQTEVGLYKDLKWTDYIIEIFFWRLDILGLILLCAVFGCILIPFTLAQGLKDQWKTAHIIVPEVIGWVVAIPAFLVWELKFAKHPLAPWYLVKDRGVYSALFVAFHVNFVWYMQGDYMYAVLLVAVNESVKSATRITSLYSFVSVITGFLLGFVVVFVRRTKKFILFGIGCWFVAFGLLVHYRGDSTSHSGIIGSLCLLGFGAGFFTYTTQVSIQASAKTHQDLAVITASYLATYNIGSAVGAAVSGAIWTNILPRELRKRISDSEIVAAAYSSPYTFIYEYTWGTTERIAVVRSYQVVQKILCIVGLCFCVTLLASAFLLRDYKLESAVALEDVQSSHTSESETTNASVDEEAVVEKSN
ncbi:LADA_0E00738g1_1 [Lachancea dasiensis]|uniref:LADA_0E00738g1_1 n=1 Tax=Lachancea dasiensis TaxID=1072105 RepID=A0A1G4JA38_9SACH|nr:LADA_0E00738g1_1 [Lachancea dasiensis]